MRRPSHHIACPDQMRPLVLVALLVSSAAWAQDGGVDAGLDAGVFDAGALDAGSIDPDDAGDPGDDDAGDPGDEDAGEPVDDAGMIVDAGGDPADSGPVDDDAGMMPADAGPVDCSMRCVGNVLTFCDGVTEMVFEVDCFEIAGEELEGRCGILSNEWGLDCLLPEGAMCAPGYAGGLSRCDPGLGLHCTEGTCQTTDGPNSRPPVPTDAQGIGDAPGEDPHPLSCLGCSNDNSPQIPLLFGGLYLFQRARRRRRARSAQAR